jgi:large subunit ribosomal protein L13
MKTFMAKPESYVNKRKWYVVDADGQVLGRLASEIAKVLRGKNKPEYTPHVDTGDHVIVVNAEKILLTGKKLDQKLYRRHSGWPGGLKEVKYRHMMERRPERAIELAVKGMLPKNSLGRKMYKKLVVYKGPEHKNQAQKPEQLKFEIQ